MEFYVLCATGVANLIGAIDGTQIPIVAPHQYPEQYFNRNKEFSINCQVNFFCKRH